MRSATVVFVTVCAGAMLSQFFRAAIAVIAPDLVQDLGVTPRQLGLLAGAFFLILAVLQIPAGLLLDRFGPRRTVTATIGLVAIGAALFATADSFAGLLVGRVLIGIGCAPLLTAAMVVVARWYPPAAFATMTAMLFAVSNSGNLLATAPLSLVTEAWGWRGAFLGMAAVTLLAGAAFWLVVRDAPPGHPHLGRPRERLGEALRGLLEIAGEPGLKYVLALHFVGYATVISVIGLWAGPYLHDVHGLDTVARGNLLLLATVGMILGHLVWGPLDRRFDSRKRVAVTAAGLTILVLAALALLPSPPVWAAAGLFFLLGVCGTYNSVLMSHGRSFFADRLAGRAITSVNFSMTLGAFSLQAGSGWIVAAFPADGGAIPEIAFRTVFGAFALVILAALLVYRHAPDTRPSQDAARQLA